MVKKKKTEDKKQKPMRTAFIRVMAHNETKSGPVDYTLEDIAAIVKKWNKTKKMKYYIIQHENETTSEDPKDLKRHFHMVFDFGRSQTTFEQLKTLFPYGDIEPAGSVRNCVQYLVHLNDDSKISYPWENIITNDGDLDRFKAVSKGKANDIVDLVIQRIEKGEIREYNLTTYTPIDVFATNKTKINNALEWYRRKVMNDKNRDITVLIMTGDTGTGKTTYAKQYAKNMGKSMCISSSSNDPMQDYKGEDVLILDDLRDDAFKFHDLLKILDNHTSSTMASRYSNKQFIGDTIIITSSQPLSSWYMDISKEDKEQLYRRITIQFQFTENRIRCFEWNAKAHKYIYMYELENTLALSPVKAKYKVMDILKGMGVDISSEMEQKILQETPLDNDSRPLYQIVEEKEKEVEKKLNTIDDSDLPF